MKITLLKMFQIPKRFFARMKEIFWNAIYFILIYISYQKWLHVACWELNQPNMRENVQIVMYINFCLYLFKLIRPLGLWGLHSAGHKLLYTTTYKDETRPHTHMYVSAYQFFITFNNLLKRGSLQPTTYLVYIYEICFSLKILNHPHPLILE